MGGLQGAPETPPRPEGTSCLGVRTGAALAASPALGCCGSPLNREPGHWDGWLAGQKAGPAAG